jgi:succinoglycan biosynthesis protein ExoA
MNDHVKPESVSIILTSFNEGYHLDRILRDIYYQTYPSEAMEILLLEVGDYSEERARSILKERSKRLRFLHIPGLSRTASLNKLVRDSKGGLIIRLDTRSHISPEYTELIVKLSNEKNVANVGGVQVPVGETEDQERIALVMKHPVCFGGGKFRDLSYTGQANSVYLGAFRRKLMPPEPWFDEKYPKISEDSDLNFRIRKSGGTVIVDSAIQVKYYPRESLRAFVKLCYNYGVGRGLFCIKHRTISAWRQMVLPISFLFATSFLIFGFFYPFLHLILLSGTIAYLCLIGFVSVRSSVKLARDIGYLMCCFIGCHLFWVFGFFRCFIPFFRIK